jgi:hypothetical protein
VWRPVNSEHPTARSHLYPLVTTSSACGHQVQDLSAAGSCERRCWMVTCIQLASLYLLGPVCQSLLEPEYTFVTKSRHQVLPALYFGPKQCECVLQRPPAAGAA